MKVHILYCPPILGSLLSILGSLLLAFSHIPPVSSSPSPKSASLTQGHLSSRGSSYQPSGITLLNSRHTAYVDEEPDLKKPTSKESNGRNSGIWSLSDLDWHVRNANASVQVKGNYPSLVHLDLLDAGVIDDPNVGLNEGTERWIIYDNWTYTADLSSLADEASIYDEFLLYFEGLDTVANVSVAGENVAFVDNQFRTWEFNVTSQVKSLFSQSANSPDSSNLTLAFQSPYLYALSLNLAPGAEFFPAGQPGPTTVLYEFGSRNYLRKQQSDFGWDWGPAYLPSGPHKPGYLVGLKKSTQGPNSKSDKRNTGGSKSSESVFISETSIDIYKKGQINNLPPDQSAPWIFNVSLDISSSSNYDSPSIQITVLNTTHTSSPIPTFPLRQGQNQKISASFEIPSVGDEAPGLWWPKTFGEPKLYEVDIALKLGSGEELRVKKRTGFRTVIVNQERYTEDEVKGDVQPGSKWRFEINGHPFFSQGSSIIPFDTFYPRVNTSTLRWHIQSALLAHQNVLRVWGGASYQSTEFYDLCDEMGILAWSETIFACSMYPVYQDFLDNVAAEVEQNVRRLNRHPSNALWAGNNEGEGYMLSAYASQPNGTIYYDQYGFLYDVWIRNIVLANTKSISYIPSSTTQGYFSLDPYVPRYYNATPGENYGDKEHYNYDTSLSFNLSSYPVARFVNEFGFHSMASVYTWDRVLTSEDDYEFNSTVVRNHNKHNPPGNLTYPYPADDGQAQMTEAVTQYYPVPDVPGDKRKTFAQWTYSTQVFQAQFMASEIAYYRLGASRPENNLGAIYWQLNDEWEATSWSSIEYGGRWKVFHYLAERSQAPVIISPIYHIGNETLDIYVTSDLWQNASGIAKWTWYDFRGNLLSSTQRPFKIGSITSVHLSSATGLSQVVPFGVDPKDAWVHLEVHAEDQKGRKYYNEQFWQPVYIKNSPLKDPKVQIKGIGGNSFEVTGKGEGVGVWVNVEPPPGVTGYFASSSTGLPSNDFYLRPGETRQLTFQIFEDTTFGGWAYNVTARSFWDNSH